MKKSLLYAKYAGTAILVFLLFFTMGSAISAYVKAGSPADDNVDADTELVEQDGERTNVLILGTDARPGEENARSDTMLLVSIDPKLDKAAVISIPRDTRVNVPGSPLDKICTANYIGGPELAVKTVEKLMNINIDYYVLADFNGFKKVIDTVGGITIHVPQRMYKPSEGIDLYPGTQKLDGYQALAFVRYRDYEFGDIERTTHQQDFLIALADELLQAKTITKLPALIKEVKSFVKTDISLSQMLRMASWTPGFTSASIITQTLPGYFYDLYNDEGMMEQSYWIADHKATHQLIDNMLEGKTVAVMQNSPVPVNIPRQTEEPEEIEEDVPSQDEETEYTGEDVNFERSNLPSPNEDTEFSTENQSNNFPGLNGDNELSLEDDIEEEDVSEEDARTQQGHWED